MLWFVSRFLLFLLLCAVGTALYMRIVDHDPARWHVDPEEAQPGDTPNDYLVAGYDAVRLDQPAATVAAALDKIALADRNTRLLAGSPAEGMMTYVATSRVMGFPDYISVAVREAEDGGTRLSLYGRARFGRSDFGVNRERIERWLATLRQRLDA